MAASFEYTDLAAVGHLGGSAVRWHEKPCQAVLPGLTIVGDVLGHTVGCQRPQTWKGDFPVVHTLHRWEGTISGSLVKITWSHS